jgi:hypothetical protein
MNFTRLRAVFRWMGRASGRKRSTFKFAGNNLSITAMALAFMLDGPGAAVLLMIMGLIVLLPMSSDPLQTIPRARMQSWPLEASERRVLRLISPWLNPMTWIVMALLLWKRVSSGLVSIAAGVVVAGFLISARSGHGGSPGRWIPRYPGRLNQMIRKNIRGMLTTLDFYCGALITVAGLGWRAAGLLPPAAFFPLTIVCMLSISTCALTLFGLDGAGGMARYRLMPVRGWQVLLAKDIAFMTIALVLALPLSLPGALAAVFVALAVGHKASVTVPASQARWRFQAGPSVGDALAQIIPMTMAGASVAYSSWLFLFPCAVAWAGSLWWFGRELDRSWR